VLALSMLAFWLLLLGTGPARPAMKAMGLNDPVSLLYTNANSYQPLAWIRGEERFPSGANIFIRDAAGQRPLIAEFAASADPVVSFDGQRVLFAGKAHASDPWQIWEISLQGGAARRITSSSEDCIRPFYLPGDVVVYAHKIAGHFAVESVNLAGGKPLAVTHVWGNAIPSDILHDGRILFSAAYPMGTGNAAELYTVYSDGSGVEAYRCDHGSARHSGKQSDSGDLLFLSAQRLGRFASARAQELPVSSPAGDYGGDFVETSAGEWLLSWPSGPDAAFGIVDWKQGSTSVQPVLFQQGASVVQPVLIAPRATPNRHPSGLHDWPNANLLCLNAYTSKYAFTPGSIRTVRMYTRDSQGAAKVLGSAPVEQDGSFFLQVPGDQPLQMELLDAAGKTLKRESGFFWMRRGEQRGCVGCHAGPETAPENAVPMVLLKSTTPFDMTGAPAQTASGGK
jgi:hypothetical protein